VTPFRRRVLAVVADLEAGTVVTYGDVAREVGHPGAARAVGSALRDAGGGLPWWRVVPASGRLADHLADRQAAHLRAEGVEVVDGRVRAGAADGGPGA
jgi:methylated-DNA-protein-cysteine methyltransferase-like protein